MTWSALETVLQQTGYPYARQGSFTEDVLPENFFTFWNFSTPEARFYDNKPHAAVWLWQVYFYTKNPELLYSEMDNLIGIARVNGFVPESKPFDLDSGIDDYVGRTVRLKYVETIYGDD